MNFLSLTFMIFCTIFLLVFFIVPKKYRYLVILLGSYIFYGYGNPSVLLFLVVTTLITYIGGLLIDKKKTSGYYYCFFS